MANYVALEARYVAKLICEEHRKALDWLNDKTSDDLAFFAVEMELWRIGNSVPAPKFNIVSQPNEWGRAVRPGVTSQNEPTETKMLQQEFWEAMIEDFKTNNTPLSLRKARAQHWYDIAIGTSNAHLSLTVNSKENHLTCGLYIKGKKAKAAYSELHEQKQLIERELGADLEWRELPHRQASRILQVKEGDFENREKWAEYFSWLRNRSEAFYKVFGKRVALLNLNGDEDEAE